MFCFQRNLLKTLITLPLLSMVMMFGTSCSNPNQTVNEPAPGIQKKRDNPGKFKDRNLFLISLDALRPDQLGMYGSPEGLSPFFDSLSRVSSIFIDTISQATFTPKSHRSILTSRYVCQNQNPEPDASSSIAGVLQSRGYRTGAFVDGGFMVRGKGMDPGFEIYQDKFQSLPSKVIEAIKWIDIHRQTRMFILFHTYAVHFPYNPPIEYKKLFLPEGSHWLHQVFLRPDLTMENKDDIVACYRASIRYTDACMSEFFRYLHHSGLFENSIVCVISDHGESLGEKGIFGHLRLDEIQLPVPWILTIPGLPPRLLDGPVELLDLAPTLLDLISVEAPKTMHGRSLVKPLLAQESLPEDRIRLTEADFLSVRNNQWKLLITNNPENDKLYDIRQDPLESHNLLQEHSRVADTLYNEFAELTSIQTEEYRKGIKLKRVVSDSSDKQVMGALGSNNQSLPDENLREQLKQLGYLVD